MKKLSMILLVFLSLGSLAAVAQKKEERSLGSFTEIKVSEAIDVYLKKGDKEKAVVETSRVEVHKVLTEVSGGRLKVHMASGRYGNRGPVKVYITFVNLESISVSSAANVFSESVIKANRLEIQASSAGSAELEIDADEAYASASSSGDMELEGKTNSLKVSVNSAGSVDAYDLEAKVVRARANSAGSAKVSASDEIDAHASSGGSIKYRGNPSRSRTDSSSGGSVRKSN
ncbi:MAG: head GIN domain-containing protein [Bacteroidota bacterium]